MEPQNCPTEKFAWNFTKIDGEGERRNLGHQNLVLLVTQIGRWIGSNLLEEKPQGHKLKMSALLALLEAIP